MELSEKNRTGVKSDAVTETKVDEPSAGQTSVILNVSTKCAKCHKDQSPEVTITIDADSGVGIGKYYCSTEHCKARNKIILDSQTLENIKTDSILQEKKKKRGYCHYLFCCVFLSSTICCADRLFG